jgi:hypothetical protein
MPPVGFETILPAREWPQIYALDRAATGTGNVENMNVKYSSLKYDIMINVEIFIREAS